CTHPLNSPGQCEGIFSSRPGLTGEAFSARFSEAATEFSQLCRVADLRDEPGLWPERTYWLFLDDLADWCRPEGDRVTSLGNGDVVLSSVLTEEQSVFAVEQVCQVEPAYGHIDF